MSPSPSQANKKILLTILVTVVLTLLISGTAAWYLGVLGAGKNTTPDSGLDQPAKETLYTCGMHPWIIQKEPGDCPICHMKLTPKRDEPAAAQKDSERKIAYWRAPMNPMEIYDQPGKSAMGMDLVPVYEDELIGGVSISIDPVIQQNMGIRTAAVKKGLLVREIRTYGHVTYDETRTIRVSSKLNGWIEKLYVDFTGKFVQKGDPLYDIYSPELLAAQEEYLATIKSPGFGASGKKSTFLESAKRRLAFFDIGESEIKAIEKLGKVQKTLTIRSPFSGYVIHKNVEAGGFIKAGALIFRISDLSKVWVEAHIYEFELPWVRVGQVTQLSFPYIEGKKFLGKVAYIYPYLQQKTRDVVIRLEFENPDLILKPDMYADVMIKADTHKKGALIPTEAVIRSGERNIVFVVRENHKFTPREVQLGLSTGDGYIQVLTGLSAADVVVTSGQFLLDSESKLKEAVQKMLEPTRADKPQKKEESHPKEETANDFFDDM